MNTSEQSGNPRAVARPCGAKTRRGVPCPTPAMANGRCRMHGGRTPVGAALPQFKDGRHSRYMPQRLLARYQEALTDSDLLAMHAEIGLLDARLADLLRRVDTGEAGVLWRRLAEGWVEYLRARKYGSPDELLAAEAEMSAVIELGESDALAWAEVRQVVQERRKLVESERKRLVEAQQVIPVEQALSVIAAVGESVRRHVKDPEALRLVNADIARLIGRSSR